MARLAIVWILGVGTAATPLEAPALDRFQFTQVEMAVPVKIVLYAADASVANGAAKDAFARLHQLNGILSDYDPGSELRRLCDHAGEGEAVPVSDELWRVLSLSQTISERSGGAFDVTIGPVVRLWRRARRRGHLPSPQRLDAARQLVGYRYLRLDAQDQAVRLLKAGMRLDLGGIAKGFATDEALAVLGKHGIDRALVDAGGDVSLGAPPPGKPGWRIGIAPLEADGPPTRYLWLSRCGIATSGDTWQFVQIDGRRYSHIVDPRTGLGLSDHSSVTVIAGDCITADGLASALSVLGPKEGLKLIDRSGGTAALIVRAPEGKVETYQSCRWKKLAVEAPQRPK